MKELGNKADILNQVAELIMNIKAQAEYLHLNIHLYK